MRKTLVIQATGKGLDSIRQTFTEEGFLVVDSSDDEAVMENLSMSPSNLVFLVDDSQKGSQICSMIRHFSNIPILALCQNDEKHKVKMLDMGADACVNWPVSPLEILARVRSLQRRYRTLYPDDDNNETQDASKDDD